MTAAVVWLVLWFVFMVVGFYGGLISLVHGSLLAGWFGKTRLIAVTVPLGLALLALSVLSLIQVILQVVSVYSLATA
jgi:hypothetical protein